MLDTVLDKSDEGGLIEDLDRIRKSNMRRVFYACYIGFDRAAWFNRHREYFDVVAYSIGKFVFQNQGKLYKLHNFDIVFTLRIEDAKAVERQVFRLFSVLQQHPTALGMTDHQIEEVTVWYQLEDELAPLLERVQRVSAALEEINERRKRTNVRPLGGAPAEAAPFSPQALADIEKALERVEVDPFIRTQPICAIAEGTAPVPLFREIFVNMELLRRQLAPQFDMRGSRALFHHMTHILDHKVLAALVKGYISTNFGPFSINLTAQTVLSANFRDFDERIRQVAKPNQIIVELQRYDIFWNFSDYCNAIDYLRTKNYRILIDGLTPGVVDMFNATELNADFVKYFIFRDEVDTWNDPNVMRKIIDSSGIVILGRCGSETEARIGFDAGFRLLQGWHLDDMLKSRAPFALAPGPRG